MAFWQNPGMPSQYRNKPSSTDNSGDEQELPVARTATETLHAKQSADQHETRPKEIGGRDGPEPTRFGDWEKAGRCIDF